MRSYPGPVKLIRRSQDEMITTGRPDELHTNRGNYLLLALLRHRYPNLVCQASLDALREFLAKRKTAEVQHYLTELGVSETECEDQLRQYYSARTAADQPYPSRIGDGLSNSGKRNLLVFLASKMLVNMEATHCAPLKPELFTPPWSDVSLVSGGGGARRRRRRRRRAVAAAKAATATPPGSVLELEHLGDLSNASEMFLLCDQ
ncbi:hypothetical protein BOX15_Mlig022648g1 [Macrostomum lignano]|uniref:Uncharacterized protein n=1 Tax=Macrostomum lignano TaxID=282301 RepID=A0A267DGC4_9PLAT|nr:hypothetical protein BOX15_Mlig022648g1 [Macrostomum lignano]